ncbi:hypothetical protein BHM03_00052645, partial [Ensete ventricosum]
VLTLDAFQLCYDRGKVPIRPRSVFDLAQLPHGVPLLGDFPEFHHPFALVGRGPYSAPKSISRLFSGCLSKHFLKPAFALELGRFSTTVTIASPTADVLATDEAVETLPAPPLDFILPRLNISAQQFGLVGQQRRYGATHHPRGPLGREAPALAVGNEEKTRRLVFVAGMRIAHAESAVCSQVILGLPPT